MSISFQSQYSPKIQEWVLSGLFEIGITEMPILYDTLHVYPFQVETRIALHRDNPLACFDALSPEPLKDQTFLVMGPDHITQRRLSDHFERAWLPLRVRVHSHLFRNLLAFVREGVGVALMDRFGVEFEHDPRFVARRFEPSIMMDMAVITSGTRPLSLLSAEFLEGLLEALRPYTPDGRPIKRAR